MNYFMRPSKHQTLIECSILDHYRLRHLHQHLLIVIIDVVLSNFTYPHRARMHGQVASDLKNYDLHLILRNRALNRTLNLRNTFVFTE